MADESPGDRRALIWLSGEVALAAWFVMLGLMFGDLL
jgi:hypothetical protein